MQAFHVLLQRHPVVFVHMVLAIAALVLGAFILARRKGDTGHRWLGRTWVLLMGGAAVSSAFIRDHTLPNIGGITPIHAFTVIVMWQLPRGVWHAWRGRIEAHRRTMRGLYQGGCIVAGLFTLLPGRLLGQWLWGGLAGLMR